MDPASAKLRCTCISPGVVTSELADAIRRSGRALMVGYRGQAIEPDACEQPNGIDVDELVVRPLATQV